MVSRARRWTGGSGTAGAGLSRGRRRGSKCRTDEHQRENQSAKPADARATARGSRVYATSRAVASHLVAITPGCPHTRKATPRRFGWQSAELTQVRVPQVQRSAHKRRDATDRCTPPTSRTDLRDLNEFPVRVTEPLRDLTACELRLERRTRTTAPPATTRQRARASAIPIAQTQPPDSHRLSGCSRRKAAAGPAHMAGAKAAGPGQRQPRKHQRQGSTRVQDPGVEPSASRVSQIAGCGVSRSCSQEVGPTPPT